MKISLLKSFSVFALSVSAVTSMAQSAKEEILKDPSKAYGVYSLYDFGADHAHTDAPKGFKPVYINHYGRHGARYLDDPQYMDGCLGVMRKADSAGKLTDCGKDILARLEKFNSEGEIRVGDLSSLGWEQQQKLSFLYVNDYPEIFRKGSWVKATSSVYARCVMTMSSFCLGLQKNVPGLDISEDTGVIYQHGICPHVKQNPKVKQLPGVAKLYAVDEWGNDNLMTFASRNVDCKSITDRLFTDSEFVREWSDPALFCYNLYCVAANSQDIPTDVSFNDIFTPEEWYSLWRVDNYFYYNIFGPRKWNDLPVIAQFVGDVEQDLGKAPGARLRFGHDSCILATLCMLDIDGWAAKADSPETMEDGFRNYLVPMAATLDFVFYGNRSGDVLVKALLNGEEVSFSSLSPVEGPYYRWSDLKDYCLKLFEDHNLFL